MFSLVSKLRQIHILLPRQATDSLSQPLTAAPEFNRSRNRASPVLVMDPLQAIFIAPW
jgi:hypothetical protein